MVPEIRIPGSSLDPIQNTPEIIAQNEQALKERGVSNIEVEDKGVLTIPILSMSQTESAKENIREVMNECHIDPESQVTIQIGTLRFSEDVSKGKVSDVFPGRPESQEADVYTYLPNRDFSGSKAPVVIFSHGGSIRTENSLKSSFLSTIKEYSESQGKPLILTSIDHRGSSSHEEKMQFCLDDRVTDLEALLSVTLDHVVPKFKELGIDWNGRVILIGNSMGGHVVSVLSSEIFPDEIILLQPAAYSPEAHFAPLGEKFSEEIHKKDSWKKSKAFDSLEEYLMQGRRTYIIGAKKDEVIPGGITRRYLKEITLQYVERAVKVEGLNPYTVGYEFIPEAHTKTTSKEVDSIVRET